MATHIGKRITMIIFGIAALALTTQTLNITHGTRIVTAKDIIYIKLLPIHDEPTRRLLICQIGAQEQVIELSIVDANPVEVALTKLNLAAHTNDHLLNVIATWLNDKIRQELIDYLEAVVAPNRHLRPIYNTIELMQKQYNAEFREETD